MLAYFLRRIIAGIVKLWILSFIIFFLVIELPLHLTTPSVRHPPFSQTHTSEQQIQFFKENLHIDKSWPLNYIDWLFDPEDITTPTSYGIFGNIMTQRPKGIDVSIGSLQLRGSGVLTGDLGTSISLARGTPVTDMFGHGISEMFVFLITVIVALMAIVAAQHWRRPQPYRVSALPTASALVDWWYLHANSPLDIAVVRRQMG